LQYCTLDDSGFSSEGIRIGPPTAATRSGAQCDQSVLRDSQNCSRFGHLRSADKIGHNLRRTSRGLLWTGRWLR